MPILDISKLQILNFHYDVIVKRYGDRAKLLFTDTDSLCYQIFTNNLHKDMAENLDCYDTSDYPEGHPLHDKKNAKVIGKFKDETNGVPPLEFVFPLQQGEGGEPQCEPGMIDSLIKPI